MEKLSFHGQMNRKLTVISTHNTDLKLRTLSFAVAILCKP